MTTNQPSLPPDVAAYIVTAAKNLAIEVGFTPHSMDQMRDWMELNRVEIGERAQSAMQKFADRLLGNQELMDAACAHIGKQVYASANVKPSKKQWNSRYVEYAKSNDKTPDEMLKSDGGSMVNYLCWKP